MSNEIITSVGDLRVSVVISWIAAIGVACILAWKIAVKIYHAVEKYRKGRNSIEDKQSEYAELLDKVDKICNKIDKIEYAQQQTASHNLNTRINNYYKLDYIPEAEFESFVKLFKSYEEVGGNGSMKIRYEKCLADLEVKVEE